MAKQKRKTRCMSGCKKRFIGILATINIWIIYSLMKLSKYEREENNFISNNGLQQKTITNNNNDRELEIPSLVILGAAKTGTRSLIDSMELFENMIQYESERHFWSGSVTYKCRPWYSESEWLWFIDNFIKNKIKLSYMVSNITNHANNTRCQVNKYKRLWLNIHTMKVIENKNKTCIHPRYYSTTINTSNNKMEYCYLMEKGPSYINSPWVAAIFSTLLPKIKVIGIIRNPITHIWSNYWAFGRIKDRNGDKFETNIDVIEQYILDSFINCQTFNLLKDFCVDINIKWNKFSELSEYERYLKMNKEYYIKLMGLYLKLRFVDPKDILIKLRLKAFMWFPISFINILFWINAYDDIDNKIYGNNFKIIQFEYLFNNISLSSNQIKCWLTNGIDCKYIHIQIEQNIENKNHAGYYHQPTDYFIHSITNIFQPFTQALQHLLNDRSHLLIGDWV